jgi:hypothetical protein
MGETMDSLVTFVILFLLQLMVFAGLSIYAAKRIAKMRRVAKALEDYNNVLNVARGTRRGYARKEWLRVPGMQKKGKVTDYEGDWVGLTRERVQQLQREYFQKRRKTKSD